MEGACSARRKKACEIPAWLKSQPCSSFLGGVPRTEPRIDTASEEPRSASAAASRRRLLTRLQLLDVAAAIRIVRRVDKRRGGEDGLAEPSCCWAVDAFTSWGDLQAVRNVRVTPKRVRVGHIGRWRPTQLRRRKQRRMPHVDSVLLRSGGCPEHVEVASHVGIACSVLSPSCAHPLLAGCTSRSSTRTTFGRPGRA